MVFFRPNMIGMAHNIAPKLRLLDSFIHSKDICWVFFFVWHFRKFRFEHISYLLETKETFFTDHCFGTMPTTVSCLVWAKLRQLQKSKQRTHKLSINWTFFSTILFYGDAFLSSCVQKTYRTTKWCSFFWNKKKIRSRRKNTFGFY